MSKIDAMGDEAAEAALSFLHEKAEEAGAAKAQVAYLEDFRKVEIARLKRLAPAECRSDAARDDWARVHPDYQTVLDAKWEATKNLEALNWKKTHAEATIEAWRTKNANIRGTGRLQ
jgi:hypothetical protein